ncbi:MAG: GNAT family N-acetyltransferase [Hyphomicrobiales bacterium]
MTMARLDGMAQIAQPDKALRRVVDCVAAALQPAAPIETQIVGVPALEDFLELWRGLQRRAVESNIFLSPDLLLPALRRLGSGDEKIILALRSDGEAGRRLVGLMPVGLARGRHGPLPAPATVWRHPFSMIGAPLIDREDAGKVLTALLERADEAGLPGAMLMPYLRHDGPVFAALSEISLYSGRPLVVIEEFERATIATEMDSERYLGTTIGSGRRRRLKRHRRRLEEIGPVTFECHERASEVVPAFEEFLALEAAGWKGDRGTAIACEPAVQTFFTEVVARLSARQSARIYALRLSGKAIAMMLVVTSGREAHAWKMAFDQTYAQHSPGVLMMVEAMAHMIDDGRIARVDSLTDPGHAMVESLWCERQGFANAVIGIGRGRARFELAVALEGLRMRAKRAVSDLRQLRKGR